ncbi:MAG TPA: mucoidy inhibitor MuiA family protein [Anaeromyxobacter sp.]
MRSLVLAVALLPAASLAADLAAASRIDAVTVYQSSARVTRAARVEVQPGPARVLLAGLPDGLDDDSIRVEGRGSAKARVFGVTVERVTGAEVARAEARAAEERLERLEDDDRGLEDRAKAAQARLEFVKSLRSTYSEERAKNLAVRGVSAKEWTDLAAFVAAESTAAAQEIRKVEVARRELAKRVAQARAELENVQAKRGQTTKTVAVEVDSDRPGGLELAVSYVVHAAGWQPIWDARLVPESSTMELSFLGTVWQRSGEDWRGVTLSVSTAQPARGLFVPELQPVWLQRFEPPRPVPRRRVVAAPSAAGMARAEAKAAAAAQEADLADAYEAEVAQASVQQGLLSATFTAPRRETVDGSGQARKVPLARFPLRATIVRTAAPRVDGSAFLTAKAVNETGFPLLAGMAGVYVGDEFAGRAPLPATPAGGEVELAFGADGRVEVDRKVLDRKHESAGLISKDEVYVYRVRTSVKNRWAAPVAVKLLDLVPVSRDEKIQVKVLDGTTAATREDPERPGVRIYELPLAAREEKVIELRYEVRYPRGFPISGLE